MRLTNALLWSAEEMKHDTQSLGCSAQMNVSYQKIFWFIKQVGGKQLSVKDVCLMDFLVAKKMILEIRPISEFLVFGEPLADSMMAR